MCRVGTLLIPSCKLIRACTMHKPFASQLVGLLISIPCLAYGARIAIEQIRIESWPSTPATIVDYSLGAHGDSNPLFRRPTVHFQYVVDGKTFSSKCVNPSPLLVDIPKFRKGYGVTCWYEPSAMTNAYVTNYGVTDLPAILMVIGGCGLAATIHCYRREIPLFSF